MPPTLANPTLRAYVRAHADDRPGVYRFYGPGEELLYVGKSVRVRTRVLSYFRAPPGEKAGDLAREAVRVEWELIPNEFGALLAEMKLIRHHRPRYNVEHTRRRAYAFVKVTSGPAPRVLPVTRVVEDGSAYFGPFARVGRVKDAVQDLVTVLGLRDCSATTPVFFDDQLEFFGEGGAAPAAGVPPRSPLCLRAELGGCLGPCCGRTGAALYEARVRMARRFLAGEGKDPLRLLDSAMVAAAGRLDFEYAALLRDRRDRLQRFREEVAAFRGELAGLSFVYRVPGHGGDDRLYLIRNGRVRAHRTHPRGREARLGAADWVEALYAECEPGPAGLTPDEAAEVLLVARWFRQRPEERRRTFGWKEWVALQRSTPRERPSEGGACLQG